MPSLAPFIGTPAARALSRLHIPETLLSPAEALDLTAEMAAAGAQVRTVGRSTSGRPIACVSFGEGPVSVCAYGFIHPDEPLGAAALGALGAAWAAGDADVRALGVRWHCVWCADPDHAALNDGWTQTPTLSAFATESFRPEHLGREVDYGFPVDWEQMYQPSWGTPGTMPPLAESLALAETFRLARPDVVASLHDTHSGGCFTFLRTRPSPALSARLTGIPGALGLPRHLGQRVDSGRPWSAQTPDCIREPTIAAEQRRMRRRFGDAPGRVFAGNVSASMHLESVMPETEFIVPEAPHFTDPAFGDTTPLDDPLHLERRLLATRRGARIGEFVRRRRHDGAEEEVLVRMRPAGDAPLGPARVPATVGRLGCLAIAERRAVLGDADACLAALADRLRDLPGPLAAERAATRVPARAVNDRSMFIFRVAPSSDRPATVAHAVDFRWRYPIHTAARVGLALRIARACGDTQVAERLEQLIAAGLREVPASMHLAQTRREAALSQLARVLAVAQDIPTRR